jgi:hypothetical protein
MDLSPLITSGIGEISGEYTERSLNVQENPPRAALDAVHESCFLNMQGRIPDQRWCFPTSELGKVSLIGEENGQVRFWN